MGILCLSVWCGWGGKARQGTRGVSYMRGRKNVPGDYVVLFPSLSIHPTANTKEGLTPWRNKCESMESRKRGVLRLFTSSVLHPPSSPSFTTSLTTLAAIDLSLGGCVCAKGRCWLPVQARGKGIIMPSLCPCKVPRCTTRRKKQGKKRKRPHPLELYPSIHPMDSGHKQKASR